MKIKCWICKGTLEYSDERKVSFNEKILYVRIFRCITCGKEYVDTTLVKAGSHVKISGKEYTAINLNVHEVSSKIITVSDALKVNLYNKSKLRKCLIKGCEGKIIRKQYACKKQNRKIFYVQVAECDRCKATFLHEKVYAQNPHFFKMIGDYRTTPMTKKQERKKVSSTLVPICGASLTSLEEYYHIEVSVYEEVLYESFDENHIYVSAKSEMGKAVINAIISQMRTLEVDGKLFSIRKSFVNDSEAVYKFIDKKDNGNSKFSDNKKVVDISFHDFLVRRSTFKCMHDSHKLKDIVVSINVDDKEHRVTKMKVPAGYCEKCKIYFIMESVYERLKKKGIIMCRVFDEKHYINSNGNNVMNLAQESILMQYGYNVNQTEGLSATTRRKILSILLDNDIMVKSEIISYLDFFINQRCGNNKYQIAISKWEADKEFVENYRIGEYTMYGVSAIYR